MQIGLILDSVIVVLLVLTITYAARLNQRLSQLRGDKKELQELARTFAEATAKAEAGIKNLKVSSDALQAEVEKAHVLRDDLEYLIERGSSAADNMVDNVSRKNKPTTTKPRHERQSDEVEDLLIEEAIRAAKPLAEASDQSRPKGNMFAPKSQPRASLSAPEGARGSLAATSPSEPQRRSVGHPEPSSPRASSAETAQKRIMGGGLGGLSPQDRLLDEHLNRSSEGSVGESDAARELLKALSSVK